MKEAAKLEYRSEANGDPYYVLDDPALSSDQRCEILADWLQDLLELQTATEESMLNTDADAGDVGALYQRVNDALILARKGNT